ncbi:hypothetical protein Tco_0501588, partial [Tanacetum coccineum]
ATCRQGVRQTNWLEPGDMRGRLGHQEPHRNRAATIYRRNVTYSGRDKTVPRKDEGRVAAPIPTDNQRGLEPQWEAG